MIDKQTYLNLKKEIRCLSYNSILKICEDMKLNKEEKQLLLDFYKGKTLVQVCMEQCMSYNTYTNHMKILFAKIYDYKNTLK